ncbi:MAG TPA: fumarylacetoacetate hydrolase family protein [Nitrososphaeraceae archaeon]|nr:fumarylacetoacetate hydrolase family protein [Nitrososphaeraceae archaeon]
MKVARIRKRNEEDTFALVNNEDQNRLILRGEIQKQNHLALPDSLEDFVFGGYPHKISGRLDKLSYSHSLNEFNILPPITRTFKIICLAFNYTDQSSWLRFGKNPPSEPVIYLKPRTSLIGPFENIICPKFVKQLDYEGELAFVIGKRCKNVAQDDALSYVAGYFIMNDVSARDIQFVDKQYSRAKGFDTFGPCGPWLTTVDEIPDPGNLQLVTRVNGEIRQNSSTKNLVLKVDRIIHRLSKVMTLEPGDIISSGTPSGTALSFSSHLNVYLRHDDIVEVEIEKLGKIRNPVVFVD